MRNSSTRADLQTLPLPHHRPRHGSQWEVLLLRALRGRGRGAADARPREMMEDLLGQSWAFQALLVAEVAFAMLLGGVIGFERELANKPAGFRTHMLVAGAAA